MIVQILVAQRQAIHALRDQIQQRMFDALWVPIVLKASGKAADNAGAPFGFLQQDRPTIGGDVSPVKAPDEFSAAQVLKAAGCGSGFGEAPASRQRSDDKSHSPLRHNKTFYATNVLLFSEAEPDRPILRIDTNCSGVWR